MKKFFFLGVFLLFITNTFAVINITINTSWLTNQTLNDNVEIKLGAVLTISAGVTVTFTGNYYLKVKNGTIIANGTSNSNIIFTTSSTKWAGIIYDSPNGGGQSQFTYCIFEYAKKATKTTCSYTSSDCGGALFINNWGDIDVKHCTFRYNESTRGGAVYIGSSNSNITTDPNFEYDTFQYNYADEGGAVACNGYTNTSVCIPSFHENYFEENLAYWSGGAFFIERSAEPIIHLNDIAGNTCDCSYNLTTYSGGGAIGITLASNPNIYDNQILTNHSICEGGGISIWDVSEPLISDNLFYDNTAEYDGGGIYVNHSLPTIEDNTMYGNITFENGGGINFSNYSDATCSGNTINTGTAYNDGGGIYCNTSVPHIFNNIINTNTSRNNGGGICCVDNTYLADHFIELNNLFGNSAYEDGGGIYYNAVDIDAYIINNLITNSISTNGGGIFFGDNQTNAIVNSNTIADNHANDLGGGINSANSIGSYTNNIIWGNTDINGSSSANSVLSVSNSFPLFTYCDIEDYSGNIYMSPNFIIADDPSFSDPGNNDYRVHETTSFPSWVISPCLNIGDNGATRTTYDLTGTYLRVIDGIIDMGAYENSSSNPNPLIFIPDNLSTIKQKENKTYDFNVQLLPNPAVSEVYIHFNLAETSNIKIDFFDIYGKIIASIADQSFSAGKQQVNWKIGNTTKGMYFCKLYINNSLSSLNKFIIE